MDTSLVMVIKNNTKLLGKVGMLICVENRVISLFNIFYHVLCFQFMKIRYQ